MSFSGGSPLLDSDPFCGCGRISFAGFYGGCDFSVYGLGSPRIRLTYLGYLLWVEYFDVVPFSVIGEKMRMPSSTPRSVNFFLVALFTTIRIHLLVQHQNLVYWNGDPFLLRAGSTPSSPYSNWIILSAVFLTDLMRSSLTLRSSIALINLLCI